MFLIYRIFMTEKYLLASVFFFPPFTEWENFAKIYNAGIIFRVPNNREKHKEEAKKNIKISRTSKLLPSHSVCESR